jgi:hypothetical protein
MCVYTAADKQCMESGLAVLCTCDIDSTLPCRPELPLYPEECAIMPVKTKRKLSMPSFEFPS